ncbi:MAG TPA: cation:proton antiporter [Steroidobacteraceae bacterium]|nr:cation:proton antiporter [Steroidobacteraceae bacterium]
MIEQPLTQILILLAASVFVVALARRLGWPPILGYLIVGMALGPHAFGLVSDNNTMRVLPELGVVFLVFTLGLEFSLPRTLAMRREVLGLGALQVTATLGVCAALVRMTGVSWVLAALMGGAIAMSSTAIILHQLSDRGELNRTHGRLAFSMLLFQDLAFVPLLALAPSLEHGLAAFSLHEAALRVAVGVLAVIGVLAAGRWLLRPLFREIAHSRLRELFTMTALGVVLAAAWISYLAGLSLALGAFLAGMMLGETEYRHQIDAVIRPFRDILLGLFFISIGMLLDVQLLLAEFGLVAALVIGMLILKASIAAAAARLYVDSTFKAVRTGIVVSIGGEFGIALLTIVLQSGAASGRLAQPLLVAVVLSMVLSPLVLNHNRAIARFLLHERGPRTPQLEPEHAATRSIAAREHVILCGYGRVGQNVARVLESQSFEYIALDIDPARIRAARQAGEPVLYGDSADPEMLVKAGIERASAVVVSFSNPAVALEIVRAVRASDAEVPVLVRTADDARLQELKRAGATEVVPETFEASLMLVSQVLMLLDVPVSRVVHTIGTIRNSRYELLRSIHRREDARPSSEPDVFREELKSIVIPPGAWAVGRTVDKLRARGAEVAITGIRRHGILGREPSGDTYLKEGDIIVVYGLPEALEHAEGVLLAG